MTNILDPTVCTPISGAGGSPYGSPAPPLLRPQSFDCLAGPSMGTLPANDTADLTSYNSKVAYHNRAQSWLAINGGHVALIGDSLIEGADHAAFADFAFSYGIGGDTLAGLMNRLEGYTALHKARAAFICMPINDIVNLVASGTPTMTTIQARYGAILDRLSGPLVVSKVLPTRTATWNTQAATLNAWLVTKLAGRANCVLVDSNSKLVDGSGLLNSNYSIDGLHLNGNGGAIWAADVRAAVGRV